MTVWAYYRVSTDNQDYESQKLGVVEYCNRCGYKIDKEIVDDGVSGIVKARDRNLWKIIKNAQAGDFLITSELSRLGRSTSDVLNTCDILSKKEVNVWFVKQSMGLDKTPMGKMMTAILSAFAEMERDLITQRTIEGLRRAKEKGFVLGRKKGTPNESLKLDKYKNKIIKMFLDGKSQNYICKQVKCDIKTLVRYCKLNNIVIPKRKPNISEQPQKTIKKPTSKSCRDERVVCFKERKKSKKQEEKEQKRLKTVERKKAKEKRIKRLEKIKKKAKTQPISAIWMF